MTKLITAAEARVLREKGMINFMNTDMKKYIDHINKIIEEQTAKGEWNYGVPLVNDADVNLLYKGKPDLVLADLLYSKSKREALMDLLKENGYTAVIAYNNFYISWDNPELKPEPEELPRKKDLYERFRFWWK